MATKHVRFNERVIVHHIPHEDRVGSYYLDAIRRRMRRESVLNVLRERLNAIKTSRPCKPSSPFFTGEFGKQYRASLTSGSNTCPRYPDPEPMEVEEYTTTSSTASNKHTTSSQQTGFVNTNDDDDANSSDECDNDDAGSSDECDDIELVEDESSTDDDADGSSSDDYDNTDLFEDDPPEEDGFEIVFAETTDV